MLSPTHFLHFGLQGADVEPQQGLGFVILKAVLLLCHRPHRLQKLQGLLDCIQGRAVGRSTSAGPTMDSTAPRERPTPDSRSHVSSQGASGAFSSRGDGHVGAGRERASSHSSPVGLLGKAMEAQHLGQLHQVGGPRPGSSRRLFRAELQQVADDVEALLSSVSPHGFVGLQLLPQQQDLRLWGPGT